MTTSPTYASVQDFADQAYVAWRTTGDGGRQAAIAAAVSQGLDRGQAAALAADYAALNGRCIISAGKADILRDLVSALPTT